MFDKSFTRSKDYFIALQLLRIMDEWVDEIMPSIESLRHSSAIKHPIFCVDEAEQNFTAAIKNMKERVDKFQNRIRRKSEEINSLRDGVCCLLSYYTWTAKVLIVLLIVVQRHITSRGYQSYGPESGHLCFYRCYRSLHSSQLPSGM